MNSRLRQSVIGLIWPGPLAGPLPLTALRLASPLLVFYLGSFFAALVMSVLGALLGVFYFELLELAGGKHFVETQLKRLPKNTSSLIKRKAWWALLGGSVAVGVFPLALSLRLLRYPKTISETLLVVSAFVNGFFWTGFVWGNVITILKAKLLY